QGADTVDQIGGDVEGEESFSDGGISRVGFEAEDAEGDGWTDFGSGDDGDGRVEFHGAAELTQHDDLSGARWLAFAQRDAALLFEVVAQTPFAVDPDARSVHCV